MSSQWSTMLGSGPVVIDGGLSTQLEARGHDVHDHLWTGRVLLDDPRAITRAHADYVEAGAQVLISSSYQVSRAGFMAEGLTAADADAALLASIAAARDAASGTDVLVAASVGPYGAILHDGSEYRGRYGLGHDALVDFHAERLEVLAQGAPDLLAIETIPDVDEVRALVEVLDGFPDLPAWVTFSAADAEHTCAGQRIEEAAAVASSASSVMAIGINCTDPRHVEGLVRRMRSATDLALVVYPNAGGSWDPGTGLWEDSASPGFAPALVEAWRQAGAVGIGGCCGTDASAIAALSDQLRG